MSNCPLNDRFDLGSVLTLHIAADAMTRGGEVLVMDADVLYDARIMTALVAGRKPAKPHADRPQFRGG
jgi:choline kinase